MSRRALPFIAGLVLILGFMGEVADAQELVFESPVEFAAANRRFPQSAGTAGLAVVAYQRITGRSETGGLIDIAVATSTDGLVWTDRGTVAPNVSYEGLSVPPVYSLAVSASGEILVAVASFEKISSTEGLVRVPVYRSVDGGVSFQRTSEAVASALSLVAPKLVQRSDGGWLLFFEHVYEGSDSRFVFTRSDDGAVWEPLRSLPIDNRIQNEVDIAHTASFGRDLIIFSGENFTALNAGFDANANAISPLAATFHLMSMFTTDGGLSWSAVDPATGETFGPRAAVEITGAVRAKAAEGRAAVEELLESVIPYWYLRVSHVGLTDAGVQEYGDIVSRRPDVISHNAQTYVAWEAGIRRETETTRQILLATVDEDGNVIGSPEILSADGLTRARVEIAFNQPTIHPDGEGLVVIAYNDPSRRGDVVLYRQGRFGWDESDVSESGIATFPTAVTAGGRLHIFWQQRDSNAAGTVTRIVHLEPDQRANPPLVSGVNYEIGRRSRLSVAELEWTAAPDAAGIAGYSYVWSRNPNEAVPLEIGADTETRFVTNDAHEDGEWYFRIRAVDRIGNWSEPGTTLFYRDTTPPGLVQFLPPALDEDGYLASNTFALRWDAPLDDVIGGYTYDLVYVATEDSDVEVLDLPVPVPPARLLSTEPIVREDNFDDGLWALSVAAIDSVGNIGEPAVLYVRMNKYIPVTQIWAVAAIQDPLGRYSLDIIGRGFLANGRITQVILDRDESPPYDYVFDQTSPGYRIFDDRNMAGPVLDDIQSGTYALGLVHAERGLTFARERLALERNGTIKFGDFTVRPGTKFSLLQPRYGFLRSVGALAWVVIALLAVVVAFAAWRIGAVTRDGRFLRLEARALITSRPLLSSGRPERIAQMKKRGIGLRTKFAFFVVILIMAVVAMIAIGLGTATLNTQRQILLQGLKDRVDVLMESIVAGTAVVLPEPEINIVRLTELPRQTAAMDEALYATITGQASAGTDQLPLPGYNYVWGTNDPIIRETGQTDPVRLQEIEQSRLANAIERRPVLAAGDNLFRPGSTQVEDPLSQLLDNRARELDLAARAALGDLPLAIEAKFQAVQSQALTLATTTFATTEEEDEAERVLVREGQGLGALNEQLTIILDEIVGPVQSHPHFDPETFTEDQRDFIFYQPIAYLESDEIIGSESLQAATYFKGAVRIAVSTDLIVEQIADARLSLIRITALIALAAVAAGVVGALLLAAIVVIPINQLVRGVETIRDTADKRKLEGHEIKLRSRDELSRLADTVNDMTIGLVAAAKADEDLKVSSDMQKMFMPLESVTTDEGVTRRLTSAHDEFGTVEFHGYYEGADALSGDYFSYERLDDKRYALIKCDVSGHGVEAAIIMVEVATIFLNQLRDWRAERKPARLTELLVTINDLVEERGFRGKFAAMTVGILDVETGRLRVSHAGDNLLQIYRADKRLVVKETLREAPATGVFPVDFFPPDREFQEVTTDLNPGDILILATDGIDESMRMLRDANQAELRATEEEFLKLCESQGWGDQASAKKHGIQWDEDSHDVREEFTLGRFHDVIASVQTRGKYVLERALNPDSEERLVFDFKRVEPTAENTVLGLMSVEKIFRLRLDPSATERDMVQVDRKIAEFLREHFSMYARYFRYDVPEEQRPDTRPEYLWFSHLKEEEQLDDLTILAIRKK